MTTIRRRFAGEDPEYISLIREPATWSAGLGALGVMDAINSDSNGQGELLPNAMLALLPAAAALGGGAALALRSPMVGKYVDDRMAGRFHGKRFQSKEQAEKAEEMIDWNRRLHALIHPQSSEQELQAAVLADTRERLRRVMGAGATAGAALGALGMLSHGEGEGQIQ